VPLYEEYLDHCQSAGRALAEKQPGEARRRLLLASRAVLQMAAETGDAALREARKQKGLRLLELVRKLPGAGQLPPGTATDKDVAAAAEGAGPAAGEHWQVTHKPGIRFQDIAGLDAVKDLIRRRVLLPFRNPELAGVYRRKPGGGILMYGPPGTGKTMMAKAIATELDAPFYSVQCSDIMSKWVGEAEANLKELFQAARAKLPSVVFFDETEALVGKRGSQSTVMNRVIPEFLAQVDGLQSGPAGILLLGATNRPWDLDPAAVRPGRFGEHIFITLPDRPARRFILQSTLGKVPCDGVDLDDLAARTEGLSGADLNGLVDRIVDPVFEQAMDLGHPVPVRRENVDRGLAQTRPSVSPRELARYERYRQQGE
jgi:transitional endoplasmic reticulum ATPase